MYQGGSHLIVRIRLNLMSVKDISWIRYFLGEGSSIWGSMSFALVTTPWQSICTGQVLPDLLMITTIIWTSTIYVASILFR